MLGLGDITDSINSNQDMFVGMIRDNLENAPENVQLNISKILTSHKNETLYPISNNKPLALADPSSFSIYKMQGRSHNVYQKDCITCGRVSFKVGIYNREEYLYYDENISQEYIYVSHEKNFYLNFFFPYYTSIW